MAGFSGPVAPWRQLADLLRGMITSGQLASGDRLPSIHDLANTYELNPTTVQKSLRALRDEGLVVSSPMGHYVA